LFLEVLQQAWIDILAVNHYRNSLPGFLLPLHFVTGEKNYCKKEEYQEKSVQFLYPYGNSALRCWYKNKSNMRKFG
jgi:hypothetical protein